MFVLVSKIPVEVLVTKKPAELLEEDEQVEQKETRPPPMELSGVLFVLHLKVPG